MENAVIVWPEGNENLSGGSTFDQQCGSIWQGLGRWLSRFSALKTKMPTTAADPAAPMPKNAAGLRRQATSVPHRTRSSHRPCAWQQSSRRETSAALASDSSAASAGDRDGQYIPRGCVRLPSPHLTQMAGNKQVLSASKMHKWAKKISRMQIASACPVLRLG